MNGVRNNIQILHWLNYLLLYFSYSDVPDVARAYFVQDGLLLRKWSLHGKDFVGDPIVQVVVPTMFRSIVLEVAHGKSGHPGLRKPMIVVCVIFFLVTVEA